jgi:hypothetical protein
MRSEQAGSLCLRHAAQTITFVTCSRIVAGTGGTIRDDGGTGEIRTPDLMLRRHPLYPSELRSRVVENNSRLCDSIVD